MRRDERWFFPSSQLSASEWEEKKVGERKNRAGEKVLRHDFFIRLHSLLLTLELWSLWDLHNRQWERLSGSSSREEGELCVLKCSVDWIMCKNYLDVWLHTEALSRRQQQIWKLLTLLQMSVHSYLTLGFQLKLQNGLQIEGSGYLKSSTLPLSLGKIEIHQKTLLQAAMT